MLRLLAAVCLALCLTSSASAQLTGYTTRLGAGGFDAAIANFFPALTLDFDTLTSPDNISDGDELSAGAIGVTFTYDFGGVVEILITNETDSGFLTTSPDNFLGTDDGGHAFQDGDDFTLTFDTPINALGLYFITAEPGMQPDDIQLFIGGNPVVGLNPSEIDVALGDGGNAYFLGVINVTGTFTSVDIVTVGGPFFTYNVDDIVIAQVPEPSSMALAAIAVGGALVWRWRRRDDSLGLRACE